MPSSLRPSASRLAPARSRRLRCWPRGARAAALCARPRRRAPTRFRSSSAELRIEEGEVLLNAEFDFSLNPTLEEALEKGIPLYFVLEFELTRSRWYWLDEKVAQTVAHLSRVVQRAHAPVPRRERPPGADLQLARGSRALHRPRDVAAGGARRRAAKGARYEAAVRLRLDVNQLPKPFQVNALASREWTLASDWHRWSFTP